MSSSFESDTYPGRPRILFVGPGESSHTHSWIDLLEGVPFNVRLFALPNGTPPDSWPVRTYVTEYYSDVPNSASRSRLFPKGRVKRFARRNVERIFGAANPREVATKALAKVIQHWQPHVIHTLGLEDASYFYLNTRKKYGLQDLGMWVIQVRGGPELSLKRLLPAYAPRIREVFEECDRLIADNPRNYEYALSLGLPSEAVSSLGVVPGTGGIDVASCERRWISPPSKRRLIVWPKTYECPLSKALPVFEAIKLAWEQIRPCEIHMLASTPETRMWFQTLPEDVRRNCHLEDRIPRARALELMAQARVMLAPALSEGVPNSMFEAMAAGALPIVSPLETIRAVVENDRNVLFARNLYPQEIADALVKAMTDDVFVDAAAEANLELVSQLADREKIRPRVIQFYEDLCGQSAPFRSQTA